MEHTPCGALQQHVMYDTLPHTSVVLYVLKVVVGGAGVHVITTLQKRVTGMHSQMSHATSST
jgi:hypothetical protein